MPYQTTAHNGKLVLHAGGSIASALPETAQFLDHAQSAVFLPYAVHDYDAYTAHLLSQFNAFGVSLVGLHSIGDPVDALSNADAIVVGGGNSFRLVNALHERGLVQAIRRLVEDGTPYWGASAGANIACPTIRTTNDMPIAEPPSLKALALVSFQTNPHYIDEILADDEMKETRESRIKEFLEENDVPVVGLREGSWLIANGNKMMMRGVGGSVLFRRGRPAEAIEPG